MSCLRSHVRGASAVKLVEAVDECGVIQGWVRQALVDIGLLLGVVVTLSTTNDDETIDVGAVVSRHQDGGLQIDDEQTGFGGEIGVVLHVLRSWYGRSSTRRRGHPCTHSLVHSAT